jgi:hypothetical protein
MNRWRDPLGYGENKVPEIQQGIYRSRLGS